PESAPRALAAFVRPRAGGALEALGVKQLFEPTDFLYESEEALGALAEALRAQGDALHLPRIPADSPAVAALSRAYKGRGFVRMARTDGYPVLKLDGSWKEPELALNAGRRSDFRRARRRAERFGSPSFEMKSPTREDLSSLLQEAWRVEAAGWKGARGSALARDRLRGRFYWRYAAAAARKGVLRLAFMRIDGRAVAMQLAAESAGKLWLLKIGHDEQYASCSPGQQLMLYVAGEAARRGLTALEFLGEEEAWTRSWTRASRDCVALRVYPFTRRGVSLLADNALRYAAHRGRALAGG
ncbi:MAG TPA: GNAT family N-acetyltransferase, partial [Croceibacterium sp.]|nr:GNAT family N-acetyltransferase [Croceibacterium sp.]